MPLSPRSLPPPILVLAFVFSAYAETPLQETIRAGGDQLESTLAGGDLASAYVQSGSYLATWRNHPDFLDVTDRIRSLYGSLDSEKSEAELERRLDLLSKTVDGIGYLDTALLASAFPAKVDIAAKCFAEAMNDPELQSNPFL